MTAVFSDANAPRDAEGRTFHLGLRAGDAAARLLSVGDAGRAARIAAAYLDGARRVDSARGFVTYTGSFRGVPVSVVATGMGTAMMDFVVRETRAVVEGAMLIVRFGTCGGLLAEDAAATVIVPTEGSVLCRRDPDHIGEFLEAEAASGDDAELDARAARCYSLSHPVLPDAPLTALLLERLRAGVAPLRTRSVEVGIDVTADSFYSSQGRTGSQFADANAGLLARIRAELPRARSMQMETFQLFDLARSSNARGGCRVRASAAAIVLASRAAGAAAVAAKEDVAALELAGGRACLEALTACAL